MHLCAHKILICNLITTSAPKLHHHHWSLVSLVFAAQERACLIMTTIMRLSQSLGFSFIVAHCITNSVTLYRITHPVWMYLCGLLSTHYWNYRVLESTRGYFWVLEDTFQLPCTRLLPCHLAMWLIDHLPARPRLSRAAAAWSRWCRICNCPNRLICRPDRPIISSSGG